MKFSNINLIICHIIVLSHTESSSVDEFSLKRQEFDKLKSLESRYNYPESFIFRNERESTRRNIDLPISFVAPRYDAQDYWNYRYEELHPSNRRTFFDNFGYGPRGKRIPFSRAPDLYQLMNSFFNGGRQDGKSKEPYQNIHRHTGPPLPPPQNPLAYKPTEATYILPHKPVRASIIKLETVTKSAHNYLPNDLQSPNYYPQVGSILNQVLIENAKNSVRHPEQFSLPVLPKPLYTPTTEKLSYTNFFDSNHDNLDYIQPNPAKRPNDTYIYATSVKNRLPLTKESVPHLSVISSYVTSTLPSETFTETANRLIYDKKVAFPSSLTEKNNYRILNQSGFDAVQNTNTDRAKFRGNSFQHLNFETLNELKLKKTKPFLRKENNDAPYKSSVEVISNLTVDGLSTNQKENSNIQNYVNYINIKNLINYETNKTENKSEDKSRLSKKSFTNDPSKSIIKNVNLNDDLSLDARILKDTNWDGLTITQADETILVYGNDEKYPNTITEKTPEVKFSNRQIQSTYFQPTMPLQIKKVKDFWEINDEKQITEDPSYQATESFTTDQPQSKSNLPQTTLLTEQTNLVVTTEASVSTTSSEKTPAPTDFILNSEVTTTQISEPTGDNERFEKIELTFNEYNTTASTTDISKTTTAAKKIKKIRKYRKRKYKERNKQLDVPQNSTEYEKEKKIINRNNFPRRQKPNITLAFGNKKIIKNKEIYGKDEVMRFSDEDVQKKLEHEDKKN